MSLFGLCKAPGLNVTSLSPLIAVESCPLPGDFHGDPADRVIRATARTLQAPLMTRDSKILTYAQKGHIQCIQV